MRMYGIDLAGVAWKDDSQLTKSDAALRGRNLTERLQELGLSYVQDVVTGKEYAGILPMFPWENAKVSKDTGTAEVSLSSDVPDETLFSAVENAGYKVR